MALPARWNSNASGRDWFEMATKAAPKLRCFLPLRDPLILAGNRATPSTGRAWPAALQAR
jgi:hypothetical protein